MFYPVYACFVVLGIAAIAIPGPVAGRYYWMESEAKEIISEALAEDNLSCQSVKVSSHDGNDYHGIATISDGDKIKIIIHYKKVEETSREIGYSIEVEPVE